MPPSSIRVAGVGDGLIIEGLCCGRRGDAACVGGAVVHWTQTACGESAYLNTHMSASWFSRDEYHYFFCLPEVAVDDGTFDEDFRSILGEGASPWSFRALVDDLLRADLELWQRWHGTWKHLLGAVT